MAVNRVSKQFWWQWILANTAGWGIGFSVALMGLLAIGFMVIPDPEIQSGDPRWSILFAAINSVAGGAGGFVIGGAQWIVLRRHVSGVGIWALTSAIGWALGLALAMGVSWSVEADIASSVDPLLYLLLGGVVTLIVVSVGQWLVLASRVRYAGWWVLVSAIGLLLGGALAFYVLDIWAPNMDMCLNLIIVTGGVGLLYGSITGVPLGMIVQHSKQV